MNYGIKEIEEFKAPSRKPWLVLLAVVVAGLVVWQIAAAVKSRRERREVDQKTSIQPAVSVSSDSSSKSLKSAADSKPKSTAVDLKASETVKPAAGDAQKVLEKARQLYAGGSRVEARKVLLGVLDAKTSPAVMAEVESLLGRVNIELALSPYDMPEKVIHVVSRGDSLDKISKKHGVTVQSIQLGNALRNPNLIKAGDNIKVLKAKFDIEVFKEKHELVILMNGEFFKRYRVGLGKFDKTPLGTFEVYDRIVEPVWWRPDGREIPFGHEENILGTRWMAFRATGDTSPVKGYGIHGTWENDSIGKSESAGCVRMLNTDVEELFNLVPLGTTVTIRP